MGVEKARERASEGEKTREREDKVSKAATQREWLHTKKKNKKAFNGAIEQGSLPFDLV